MTDQTSAEDQLLNQDNSSVFLDDDDDDEVPVQDSTDRPLSLSGSGSRDERQEVYKMSAKDTRRVRLGRLAVTVVLLLTALTVTLTTYKLLKREEQHSFRVAFDRFSRTVGDAAIQQQLNIRESLRTLAHSASNYALAANQS
ncbi:expressed unknown protein [Seminavis robusta]|uniref:Uncharacterized protein n=1 Tax=Seminavis robusta TaxID=568900 RepID=A0A9N8DBF4_9STRA|nr:expressed unknown protein [Seminavis robusta]|eukprot:Sro7_g006230.1 n/a (142) ;mRNA; r:200063-200590